MSNDMCAPSELGYLPGAPFTNDEVDGAVSAIQGALGWHVAPEDDSTVVLNVLAFQRRLMLPTRKLVAVTEIRVDGDVVDPSAYTVDLRRCRVVKNSGYWTAGVANTEVDFTHGFEETPKELLPLIAEAAAIGRRDESVKPYRLAFDSYDADIPDRYSLYRRTPGMV